jgi:hypothetical protein
MPLPELRLMALAEESQHPADSPFVLELVERLLQGMPSLDVLAWRPAAGERLAEAGASLGEDRPEGTERSVPRWYRLRGRLLRALDRTAEAYEALREGLLASDHPSQSDGEDLLEAAREAGMLGNLKDHVNQLPAAKRRRLLRLLADEPSSAES